MKKIVTITVLSALFSTGVKAQTPSGNANNNSIYMGYQIRLIPAGSGGFGYEIFFKSKMVVHQPGNPFTLAPTGLRSSEDALKVAHWQVQQLWGEKRHEPIVNGPVSIDVAKRLNVSIK